MNSHMSDAFGLEGEVAWITGGGTRLGLGIAKWMANRGKLSSE